MHIVDYYVDIKSNQKTNIQLIIDRMAIEHKNSI